METDKEVTGEHGNSYTTQFRQYDPRLGRWKSIDPKMHDFPGMSPYCAFNNNPNYFTDPLGLAAGEPDKKKDESKADSNPDAWSFRGDVQEGDISIKENEEGHLIIFVYDGANWVHNRTVLNPVPVTLGKDSFTGRETVAKHDVEKHGEVGDPANPDLWNNNTSPYNNRDALKKLDPSLVQYTYMDEGDLDSRFRRFANQLSIGEGEDLINSLIDHMNRGDGEEYSSPLLTKLVLEHSSTQRFIEDVEEAIRDEVHEGDAFNDIANTELDIVGNPRYNTTIDLFTGLRIAVNDMQRYDVDITLTYPTDKGIYVAYELNLYDHFGLDPSDIQEYSQSGFKVWFVLQHYNPNYNPFVTKVAIRNLLYIPYKD